MTEEKNKYMKDYREKNIDKMREQEKRREKKRREVSEKMRHEKIMKIIEDHKDNLIGNPETKDFVISLVKHFLPYLEKIFKRSYRNRCKYYEELNYDIRVKLRDMTIASAMVFLAYRKMKMPILANDISTIFDTEKVKIMQYYRLIKKELGMHPCKMSSLLSKKCIILFKPEDFLVRFGKKLEVSDKTIEDAKQILRECHEFAQSKNPTSLAAGALYIAVLFNQEKKTQREIADIAGTTEVTVRNISKGLLKQNKKNG